MTNEEKVGQMLQVSDNTLSKEDYEKYKNLGIGSFLGVINLAVGVLSAFWLGVQLYGYLAHELPMKRMRKQLLRRQLERNQTQPAELGRPRRRG